MAQFDHPSGSANTAHTSNAESLPAAGVSEPETPPLDLTDLALPPRLAEVARGLCALKLHMDRQARSQVGQPFLDDWMDDQNTCAYHPNSLVQLVLPFVDWQPSPRQCLRAWVNPRHVIGASIKGLPEHVAPNQVPATIARYAQTFGTPDNAYYVWIKPLGLFYAHEGKHRVAFMRAHEQPAIAAWVREASYPAAERLAIVRPTDERDEWLAALDGRYLQVLRRPRTSCLLLQAYGVPTLGWRDVPHLPQEHRVRQEIYRRKLHRPPRSTAAAELILDLASVHSQTGVPTEKRAWSVLDLPLYRCDWLRLGLLIAASLTLGMLLSLLDQPWGHSAGLLSMGLGCGLILSLKVMRFFEPKAFCNDDD
ncbi:Uncharacterised protein [Delftia tsuruhatensis]|uniref:hypothetical protein n=1 Tax=Delftia tsuruhatensis TaxID=180282 RepID=UPI001E76DBFE|nr:hypothetical protein [Delftia tsuruhatensis]CAB5670630.1 Uncharacterised protein [Delftia tsuruhatensis]CAC9683050.1 Uncharacterised protein [Delftia tsuruhatensis]